VVLKFFLDHGLQLRPSSLPSPMRCPGHAAQCFSEVLPPGDLPSLLLPQSPLASLSLHSRGLPNPVGHSLLSFLFFFSSSRLISLSFHVISPFHTTLVRYLQFFFSFPPRRAGASHPPTFPSFRLSSRGQLQIRHPPSTLRSPW